MTNRRYCIRALGRTLTDQSRLPVVDPNARLAVEFSAPPRESDCGSILAARRAVKEKATLRINRLPLLIAAACLVLASSVSSANAAIQATWMPGYAAPGTPAKYDKIGVLKIGPRSAGNVLVLVPGTSAGSAYFVPLAKWLVSRLEGWQVWSVERRENLLEDQSVLNLAKRGKATAKQLFDYYLGFLTDPSIKRHFQFIPNADCSSLSSGA